MVMMRMLGEPNVGQCPRCGSDINSPGCNLGLCPKNEGEDRDGLLRTLRVETTPGATRRLVRPSSTPKPLPADVVVLPSHYARFRIEPIHFIGENGLDFLLGNAIKYIMRADHKHASPVEDVSKAIRYLIMRTKKMLGDPRWAGPYRSDIVGCLEKEFDRGTTA